MNWSVRLRSLLHERALAWAASSSLPSYESLGSSPTVLFEPTADGSQHGNFHDASWKAITANPSWARRLLKSHPKQQALPLAKRPNAKELDSSNSSDALLMNCFCFPEATPGILEGLGLSKLVDTPEFGYSPGVPLAGGQTDATEVDMRIGRILFEAKLTEANFTSRPPEHVRRYRDLETCFDVPSLPLRGGEVVGYQLVRNVLAALHTDTSLCVLLDGRRPDLLQEWWQVHSAIVDISLRSRCTVRTWQELAAVAPRQLASFLKVKYGL